MLFRVLSASLAGMPGGVMLMAWFKDWFGTEYYKMLYSARNEDEARHWVSAIIQEVEIPAQASVLDMACGRGRHLYWFAQAGLQVTGIDLSEGSIKEARQRVPEAELSVHDIREPFAEGRFDLVVSLFTSLGYFDDPADDQKVMNAAFKATRQGGYFVLDFMNAQKTITTLQGEENKQCNGVRFVIRKEVRDDRIVKTVTVHDGDRTKEYQEKVRVILPHELRSMVINAGFHVDMLTGDHNGSEFDPEWSDRLVIWAQRR